MIFSSIVLHAVTFSYVLHLQGQIKMKVKTEISLCMAISAGHCHPYIHSTTVLCDTHAYIFSTLYAHNFGMVDSISRIGLKIVIQCCAYLNNDNARLCKHSHI